MNSSIAILTAENSNLDVPQDVSIMPILFSQGIFDDITIHDFLIEEVLPANPTVLIIPASLGTIHTDYWGFRIGMHIRLTKALDNLRFIPLLFVSDDSLEEILVPQKEKLAVICSTPGSMLVRNDEGEINKALERLKPLDLTDYTNGFLKSITINRPDSTGKHSLANIWGVSRLAEATGLQHITKANNELNNRFKDLYFKYLQAFAESQSKQEGEIKLPELADIKAENKQILLIDDEADNGWGDVLKPLFKNNLTCISGKGKSVEDFYKEAKDAVKNPVWDLILLDLRLDPKEDIGGNEYKMARQYSGAKLLEYIKQQNGGNQVIMFTASNKAWNMQELLKMRADGYYVKESPEFDQSLAFSVLNFNSFAERVNVCLEYSFLKYLWASYTRVQNHFNTQIGEESQATTIQILSQLQIGFDLLCQKRADSPNYAMLCYFRVLEILSEHYINIANPNDNIMTYKTGMEVGFCKLDKGRFTIEKYDSKVDKYMYTSASNKIQALSCQKLGFDPRSNNKLLDTIRKLATKRNGFIHPKNRADYTTPNSDQLLKWSKALEDILLRFS